MEDASPAATRMRPSSAPRHSACVEKLPGSKRSKSALPSVSIERRFAEEARRGVHLFLSDSTNAEDPGATGSERSVGPVLRDIVRAAGGTHDDWDEYDRVMAEDRRAAVLVTPRRTYPSPTPS